MSCKHIGKETCINKDMYTSGSPSAKSCQNEYVELPTRSLLLGIPINNGKTRYLRCNGYEEDEVNMMEGAV